MNDIYISEKIPYILFSKNTSIYCAMKYLNGLL